MSSRLSQLLQTSELHLLLLVPLLEVTADVVLNSATHHVMSMAHMAVVARKQNTVLTADRLS